MDIVNYVKSFPLRTFEKNEVLFTPNVSADTVLIIRQGVVKVLFVTNKGDERLMWLAGRYDVAPIEDVLRPVSSPNYLYMAFSRGSGYVVDKRDLLSKANKNTALALQLARGLSEQHDDLLRHITTIQQTTLRQKILHLLQHICQKFSGAELVALHENGLNLTHQAIADMIDASREAVSIEMKRLQSEGVLEYSRTSFTVNVLLASKKIGLA